MRWARGELLLRPCTPVPQHPSTLAPQHPSTRAPRHRYASAPAASSPTPLHSCALAPRYSYTPLRRAPKPGHPRSLPSRRPALGPPGARGDRALPQWRRRNVQGRPGGALRPPACAPSPPGASPSGPRTPSACVNRTWAGAACRTPGGTRTATRTRRSRPVGAAWAAAAAAAAAQLCGGGFCSAAARWLRRPALGPAPLRSPRPLPSLRAALAALEDLAAPEAAACAICQRTFRDPVRADCGHQFCRACVVQFWAEEDGPFPCPECADDCWAGHEVEAAEGENKGSVEIMRKDLNDARDLHGQAESAAAVWKGHVMDRRKKALTDYKKLRAFFVEEEEHFLQEAEKAEEPPEDEGADPAERFRTLLQAVSELEKKHRDLGLSMLLQ
ncbi:E3 ubiquitin-protein ligase RNF187 [Trichechus manatus latirostris]|uniref:E3 ubiquitin-protein ligase RNF187 n=1 Tax=Trichechus manatus latirostris TaxID=127582 RepID=A0A2Y9RMJ8_TRIMA|nr:E3 ubiquitin-protein ligase RNF187 [Trichechus manatus latirostris]